MDDQLVLTQLQWDTSEPEPRWHRDDALWWSDWRSLPQQGTHGPAPQGWILAGFPQGLVPPNSVDLGDSLGGLVRPGRRASMQSVLGLGEQLPGDSLSDIFQSLLVRMGDPTSEARWRGIRANGRRLQLRIGGVVVLDEPFDEAHPAWSHTRDIFRAAYRRNRAQVDAGLMPLEALQRYTGHEMRKYGVTHDALLPSEYLADGWRPPRTTIGDTFVEGSDTALESHTATGPNGGFGWSHIEATAFLTVYATPDRVENENDANAIYRADSDLSSDDHYCQSGLITATDGKNDARVIIRKDSTGTMTYYHGAYRWPGDRQRIEQRVGGSTTTLSTKTATNIPTSFTGYIEIDSNDVLRQKIDGATEQTFDDSASPVGAGNLRTGLYADVTGGQAQGDLAFDDFEAADLAAAAAKRRRVGMGAGSGARR